MTVREIAALFEDLELRLIESLKRNLARHKAWEKDEGFSWAAWQAEKLRHLWRFRRENAAILGEYAEKIDVETRALLKEQFAESADPEMPDRAFFGVNGKKLDALVDEMTHNEQRVERASLRYMDDIYRKTILRAATSFNAGGVTMQQATDMATRDFLERGISCIRYRDGRMVNIATYAEMALRTCNTRAMLLGEAQRREELGIDTVLVSQYGACSDTCLPWQGLVYIDDVWQPYHGESNLHMGGSYGRSRNGRSYLMLSVAVKAGLFHPNCRHHLTTWIEGVSQRPEMMDKAEIERVSRLEKKQRALERRVRKYKRLAAGTLDTEKAKEYRAKVRDAQKAVREFVAQHGDVLRRDYWRERDTEGFGTPASYRQVSTAETNNEPQQMAAASNNWQGAEITPHTEAELNDLDQYAKEHGIRLYHRRPYQGDIDLLKSQIDIIEKIRKDFNHTDPLQLGWKRMGEDDFGETSTNHQQIWINDLALFNREITEKNLAADDWLAANSAEGIAAHEMGHVLSGKIRNGKTGLDIYRETVYNVSGKRISDDEALSLLFVNVSKYSADEKERLDSYHTKVHDEIIPEMLSVHYTAPNKYSTEFVRLLKEACSK